jgi:hypothetical protein
MHRNQAWREVTELSRGYHCYSSSSSSSSYHHHRHRRRRRHHHQQQQLRRRYKIEGILG